MHNLETMYDTYVSKAEKEFIKECSLFFKENGYSFSYSMKEGDDMVFYVNEVPFKFNTTVFETVPNGNIMTEEMFQTFEEDDEDFESETYSTLEEICEFLNKYPKYRSTKLGQMNKQTGLLESVKKFKDFYAN